MCCSLYTNTPCSGLGAAPPAPRGLVTRSPGSRVSHARPTPGWRGRGFLLTKACPGKISQDAWSLGESVPWSAAW